MLKIALRGYSQAAVAMAKTVIMPVLVLGGLYLTFFTYDPFAFVGNVILAGIVLIFLVFGYKKSAQLYRARKQEEEPLQETLRQFIEKGGS